MIRINTLFLLVVILSACSSQPKEILEREEVQIEYKPITLKVPKLRPQCSVGTQMSYGQRDNIVRLEMMIASDEDQGCQVSRGEFNIKVEFDRVGEERQTLQFEETWARSKNEALGLDLNYEIGFNTTLRSVKKTRSRCWCEDVSNVTVD